MFFRALELYCVYNMQHVAIFKPYVSKKYFMDHRMKKLEDLTRPKNPSINQEPLLDNPKNVVKKAKALIDKGDIGAARDILEGALKHNKKNPYILSLLIFTYNKGGDIEAAKAIHSKYKDAFNEVVYTNLIFTYSKNNILDLALSAYHEAKERDLININAVKNIVEMLLDNRRFKTALNIAKDFSFSKKDARPIIKYLSYIYINSIKDAGEKIGKIINEAPKELKFSIVKGLFKNIPTKTGQKKLIKLLKLYLDTDLVYAAYYIGTNRKSTIEIEGVLSKITNADVALYLKRYLIELYFDVKDYARAEALFKSIEPSVSYSHISRLLSYYTNKRDVKKAEELFARLRDNHKADIFDYTNMLNLYAEIGDIKAAERLYAELPFPPDDIFLTTLMKVYSRFSIIDKTEEIFNKLRKPNIKAYNILLNTYISVFDLDKATKIAEKMRHRGFVDDYTITSFFILYAFNGNAERIDELAKKLKHRDDVALASLWRAYILLGRFDKADAVLNEVINRNILTDTFKFTVINTLIDLDLRDKLEELLPLLDVVLLNKSLRVKLCAYLNKDDETKKLAEEILNDSESSYITYFNLVRILINFNYYPLVYKAIERLKDNDTLYYNSLYKVLDDLANKGDIREIKKVDELYLTGCTRGEKQRSLDLFILKAYYKARKYDEMENYYRTIKGNSVSFEVHSFMFSYFVKRGMINNAEEELSYIRNISSERYYKAYISYLYITKNYERILSLKPPKHETLLYTYYSMKAEAFRKLRRYNELEDYLEFLRETIPKPSNLLHIRRFEVFRSDLDLIEAYATLSRNKVLAGKMFRDIYKRMKPYDKGYVRTIVGIVFARAYSEEEAHYFKEFLEGLLEQPLRGINSKADIENAIKILEEKGY